ncbi:MAG: acetyl-CoA carboxylase biotin carboxyl carrier protein subunit [Eubacteriales bacterium]|nr:acetyl-CoA carboxylase biotin carboxyl carrier protein subunit [Eubacteriales bacterium]
MRKYLIKVNGTAYEVEVEALGDQTTAPLATAAAAPAAPVAIAPIAAAPAASAAATTAAAIPVATPAAATGAMGSTVVKAPMPGTILKVSVAVGDTVKKNQVLCVLEAMKMENEIVAPREGVVAGVHTTKGSSAQAGDPLVSLQ